MVKTTPPLPSDRVVGFPQAVEALLMKMLSKLPADRQSSYPQLLLELRQVLALFPSH